MRGTLQIIVAVVVVELAIVSVVRKFRAGMCQRNDFTLKPPRLSVASTVSELPNCSSMMVPPREIVYQPAPLEQYLVDNAIALGFDKAGDTPDEMASGCEIWNNEENLMYNTTQTFRRELKNYYAKIASFRSLPDLRTLFLQDESNRDEVCKRAELDPVHGLLEGFFNESKQLSYSSTGYLEPLFPPMRHPDFCDQETVLSLAYLVHDFGVMCRRLSQEDISDCSL
jgi:hypothetical protein